MSAFRLHQFKSTKHTLAQVSPSLYSINQPRSSAQHSYGIRLNCRISSSISHDMQRRNLSTPQSQEASSSKQRTPSSHDHAAHSHVNDHSHNHDHDHSGLFHSHSHDHSEGAQQIMQAIQTGRLDRGTRITLLGNSLQRALSSSC
jgi:hypothetical protein